MSNYIIDSDIINYLKQSLILYGEEKVRRGRLVREINSFTLSINGHNLSQFSYRQKEYKMYLEMIIDQKERFLRYLNIDLFSRRLLIQFPVNWYDDKEEDYMVCPESFLVLYDDEYSYDVIFNERSTEYKRATEDIAIIKAICDNFLHLKGEMNNFKVHYMNLHMYLDDMTSEDFNAKEGYFNLKKILEN